VSSASNRTPRLDLTISLAHNDPISPAALACACWAFTSLENYAEALADFRDTICGRLDLSRADHLDAFVVWLNRWKCRLPEHGHHEVKARLHAWYALNEAQLPSPDAALVDAPDSDLERCGELYESLIKTMRRRGTDDVSLKFKWTAASKTLFALLPQLAPAWDQAMRDQHLRGGEKYDGGGASYARFAKDVRTELQSTARLCERQGFALDELPQRLGRPDQTTAAQLMIEYYFVVITKGAGPPPLA
jgi:hypothetical protein